MKQALGLIEISGLSTAVLAADTMAKAANIRILEIENTKGLGYMTIKIAGDVGAVNAAVNAGKPGNSRRTGAGRRAGRFCEGRDGFKG